jgi:hypothetical protein
VLTELSSMRQPASPANLLWIDPYLIAPSLRSGFVAVQQRITQRWTAELTGIYSNGDELVTTDIVNRLILPTSRTERVAEKIPYPVQYRGNQGSSEYKAIAAMTTFRTRTAHVQVAYTLGHSWDNQSDPLRGDFFDFNLLRSGGRQTLTDPVPTEIASTFTRQFNPDFDWGSSDYDQRHSVMCAGYFEIPRPIETGWLNPVLRGWQMGFIAGARSGFPYSVYAGTRFSPVFDLYDPNRLGETVSNNRADRVDGLSPEVPGRPDSTRPGAVQVLDPLAFRNPPVGALGAMRRNELYGPGSISFDLSVAKSFSLGRWRETARIQFRADAFNALNHANVPNPETRLGVNDFGMAYRGRRGSTPAFPALTPLLESPRQIELHVKLYF